jgi:hypothetical protein
MEGIRIKIRILTNNDGSGSGRSKNIRIQINNTGKHNAFSFGSGQNFDRNAAKISNYKQDTENRD